MTTVTMVATTNNKHVYKNIITNNNVNEHEIQYQHRNNIEQHKPEQQLRKEHK
jgi:uncharacterized pyridoxamine 5'-phosphate oxidase family protein